MQKSTEEIIETIKCHTKVTRESVLDQFNDLIGMIEKELLELKENPDRVVKNGNSKFLRNVNKQLKTIRGQSARIMKKTKSVPDEPNVSRTNTGFQKPVKISKELATFAGWPENSLHSRVEVTKYICEYIKEHNLQNPANKREIIPNPALQKLLGYDDENKKGLPYYSIQSCLKNQNHFIKES